MPVSCHFRDCKALLVTSLTHVSGTITSVQTYTLTLYGPPFTFIVSLARLTRSVWSVCALAHLYSTRPKYLLTYLLITYLLTMSCCVTTCWSQCALGPNSQDLTTAMTISPVDVNPLQKRVKGELMSLFPTHLLINLYSNWLSIAYRSVSFNMDCRNDIILMLLKL